MPDSLSSFHTFRHSLEAALLRGSRKEVETLTGKLLDPPFLDIPSIFSDIIVPIQISIGERWINKEIDISEEHVASSLILEMLNRLRLATKPIEALDLKIAVGCLTGEHHNLAAILIADLLRYDGWQVHFLGANLPAQSMVNFLQNNQMDAVAISMTVDCSLDQVNCFLESLRDIEPKPVTLVGGHALSVNPSLVSKIKADIVCTNAATAINQLRRLFMLASNETVELNDYLKSLGSKIQANRETKGLTQLELATKAKMDRGYLSAIERGKQNISIGVLFKISEALEVNLRTLLRDG